MSLLKGTFLGKLKNAIKQAKRLFSYWMRIPKFTFGTVRSSWSAVRMSSWQRFNVPIIVSVTSYGPRLPMLSATLKSLTVQTVRPISVEVWLTADDIKKFRDLHPEYTNHESVEICEASIDLKSHKKYFYAAKKHTDCRILCVDDDTIYPPDFIETLYLASEKFPNAIIGSRGHRIKVVNGRLLPYKDWEWEFNNDSELPRNDVLLTGVGGILYPAGFFDENVLQAKTFMKLAPDADDLWLRLAAVERGYKHVLVKVRCWKRCIEHPAAFRTALSIGNIADHGNDATITKLLKWSGISSDKFAGVS